MFIIFGWQHYTRTRVLPSELSFAVPPHYREFQLRQYYAHILFLPIFPLQTYWLGLTPENKLFKLEDDLQEQLWDHRDPGTPFITMLVPLVALAALIIFLISVVWQNETRTPASSYATTANKKGADKNKMTEDVSQPGYPVLHPSLDDYYTFKEKKEAVHRKYLHAKVTGISDDALQLTPLKKLSEQYYNASDLLVLFEDTLHADSSFWVKKSTLLKLAIRKSYSTYDDTILFNRGAFFLDEVRHVIDSPMFRVVKDMVLPNGNTLFRLNRDNEGIFLWIKSLSAVKGKMLPREDAFVGNEETGFGFQMIETNFQKHGDLSMKLELRDMKMRKYTYRIDITEEGDSVRVIPLKQRNKN